MGTLQWRKMELGGSRLNGFWIRPLEKREGARARAFLSGEKKDLRERLSGDGIREAPTLPCRS